MADVGIWCEWEAEVEADPEILARGVQWMVGRLVDEAEEAGVAPVGVLTITDHPVESLGGARMVRRAVNLAVDPDAVWEWSPPFELEIPPADRGGCLWQMFRVLIRMFR